MKAAAALAAIAVALALQTTLASLVIRGLTPIDLVLIVVVYIALIGGPSAGLLAGSAAGLIQDALSSGIVGIGGLAKTVVGFVAGILATQFIVTAPLSRLLVFVIATVLHAAIFMGLYASLGLRTFEDPYADVLSQAIGNGIIGVVAAHLFERLPGLWERRRVRRR